MNLFKKWWLMTLHSERGGGGGSAPTPAPIKTQQEIASDTMAAKSKYDPQAAALEFGIQQEYMPQMAGLAAQSREIGLPGGAELGQNLMDVTLQQLINPTGITAGEQQVQGDIRNRELDRFSQQERTRANLGGGLYGGRSAAAEGRGLGELTQQFEAQDYNRVRQQQQFAQQMALQQMSQYLGVPVQTLQYMSPTASPESATSANTQATIASNNLIQQNYQAQQAQKAALQSSLFSALGTAAGAVAGGPMGAALGSKLGGLVGGGGGGGGVQEDFVFGQTV